MGVVGVEGTGACEGAGCEVFVVGALEVGGPRAQAFAVEFLWEFTVEILLMLQETLSSALQPRGVQRSGHWIV